MGFLCDGLVHLAGHPQSRQEVILELRLHLEQFRLLTEGGEQERWGRQKKAVGREGDKRE